MRQEDYILREIQKIGVLLMGLIGKLRQKQEWQQISNELGELEDVMDLSVDQLISLEPVKMIESLIARDQFDSNNMELLAQTLYDMGYLFDHIKKGLLLERALFILEYLEMEEQTYSVERQDLIERIKKV